MHAGLEVADVFRDGADRFLAQYGPMLFREQRQVLRDVVRCRTAELGGHVQECDDCGHQRIQYNSCRNRHCPKCQAMVRAKWLQQRESELLPVPYFHVVFTLPHELGPLALQNKRVVYGLLFQAAAQTLSQIAAHPKHLGATIGCLMVLHTWGQNLMHHPHVHAIVTGGGLSPDGSRWIACKQGRKGKPFFLPVRVLSRVFRGKFIAGLKRAFAKGDLQFHGQLESLNEPERFEQLLTRSVRRDWIVYAKRPFGGPGQVLKYLARYTHRVAISNRRLIEQGNGQVSFRYTDYADGHSGKVMTLSSTEFIRRFLMHTLPSGFVRIRYYGFLANRYRNERLEKCRRLLGVKTGPIWQTHEAAAPAECADLSSTAQTCPACQRGNLLIIDVLPAAQPPRRPFFLVWRLPQSARFTGSSRSPPCS
jgi:hypothetical protein